MSRRRAGWSWAALPGGLESFRSSRLPGSSQPPGTMALFPSYLFHERRRFDVAFDVVAGCERVPGLSRGAAADGAACPRRRGRSLPCRSGSGRISRGPSRGVPGARPRDLQRRRLPLDGRGAARPQADRRVDFCLRASARARRDPPEGACVDRAPALSRRPVWRRDQPVRLQRLCRSRPLGRACAGPRPGAPGPARHRPSFGTGDRRPNRARRDALRWAIDTHLGKAKAFAAAGAECPRARPIRPGGAEFLTGLVQRLHARAPIAPLEADVLAEIGVDSASSRRRRAMPRGLPHCQGSRRNPDRGRASRSCCPICRQPGRWPGWSVVAEPAGDGEASNGRERRHIGDAVVLRHAEQVERVEARFEAGDHGPPRRRK